MKIVPESEVQIINNTHPVIVKYKNKEYIYFRGTEYVSYDKLPADCFEVRFSKQIISDLSSTLTFVPK